MSPLSTGCSPAIASRSSFWPLFEIPAMPRISPEFAVKDTLSSFRIPSSLRTVRPEISSLGSTFFGSGRSMFSSTAWPTIMSVISWTPVSLVFRLPMNSPARRMSTRSEISRTSFSLCVMMTTALLSFLMLRRTSNSFSVSCGVRTAVGSSRIRISAFR